jgi:hypothetical protein
MQLRFTCPRLARPANLPPERGVSVDFSTVYRSGARVRAVQLAAVAESDVCIFAEDWWLDAAAPGEWDRVRVERDGRVVGEQAFSVRKRWGVTFLEMPKLTRTLSPRLLTPIGKPVTRRLHAVALVEELVSKLPRHDRLELALAPDCPSVQGFVQCNFAVTHTYTYRSSAGLTADRMLSGAHQKTRNVVTHAMETCAIEHGGDLERFIRLHAARHGKADRTDHRALARIYEAARARGQAEIIFVQQDGVDTAAAILVWDAQTVYYWMSARVAISTSSGDNSLAIYEAMRMAEASGRRLDLDGYDSPQASLFLMKFGLQPVVRPFVNRSGPVWKGLNLASSLRRHNRVDRHYRV